jgi:transposase
MTRDQQRLADYLGIMPIGKALTMPRRGSPGDGHPHEPPDPPKNYGADIATLIELLEFGRT